MDFLKLENTIFEIKNSLDINKKNSPDSFNSRWDIAEDGTSQLKYRQTEHIPTEAEKLKKKKRKTKTQY